MSVEREVNGLRCFAVLELLSEYLDGEVTPELARQIEGHLAGCDVCERFGNEVGEVVRALKTRLGAPPSPAPDLLARLLLAVGGSSRTP